MPIIPPPHTYYTNTSKQVPSLADRGRKVAFRGETPNLEYMGFIEVLACRDGEMEIHVERSMHKKYVANAKWHTESVYATISGADWDYLLSVPRESSNKPDWADTPELDTQPVVARQGEVEPSYGPQDEPEP